jgi:hypothetical protein
MQKAARFVALILIFIFLANFSLVSSQDPAIHEDNPSTLDNYDVVARGKMSRGRGKRPVQIARMDNNGEILLACLEAKTVELTETDEMKGILGMETRAQAAMFLHYEIRYAFLDYQLKKGIIKAPVHFNNADNNSPTDVRNLVFLMKTEASQ